jgi:hypothetical protein
MYGLVIHTMYGLPPAARAAGQCSVPCTTETAPGRPSAVCQDARLSARASTAQCWAALRLSTLCQDARLSARASTAQCWAALRLSTLCQDARLSARASAAQCWAALRLSTLCQDARLSARASTAQCWAALRLSPGPRSARTRVARRRRDCAGGRWRSKRGAFKCKINLLCCQSVVL